MLDLMTQAHDLEFMVHGSWFWVYNLGRPGGDARVHDGGLNPKLK